MLFILFLGIVVFAAFYLRAILFRRSSRPYPAASPGISRTIGSRRRRQANHLLWTFMRCLFACILPCHTCAFVCLSHVNCASRDIAAIHNNWTIYFELWSSVRRYHTPLHIPGTLGWGNRLINGMEERVVVSTSANFVVDLRWRYGLPVNADYMC